MRRHLKSCVMGVSCLPFLALPALAAGILPSGGNFASGSGHISSTPTQLTVNQMSKNGIINWGSFSIGPGNGVQINNGSGATLNRVTGNSLSQIDGSLQATGSVYLINQNGIVVTPTGQVVTGGDFVASTRDTTDRGFGSGAVHLSGTSGAGVTNEGSITTGGNAVLVGKSAINSGAISAPNGVAALVAGDDVMLQPGPEGLQIKVNTGSGDATNSSTIAAAQAMLNAVGGNVYAMAGTNSVISATGTAKIDGHVWLTAGGAVDVEAPVSAQNADVTISGTGTAAQPVGVTINNVVSSSGNVTVTGAGYAGTTANSAYGVEIGGTIAASGVISVTGTGGNNNAPNQAYSANPLDPCVPGICNYGVYINGGAVISSAGAPVTITGIGGGAGGTSFGNDGVFIYSGLIQGGGAISITGTGGATSGPSNFGVTNEGEIYDTGAGNISLTGTSGANGAGAEVSPLGIGQVGVANLGAILGTTGDISITGTVGANAIGIGNVGIGLASLALIAPGTGVVVTGGNGNIMLNGTANGQGYDAGVDLLNFSGLGSPSVMAANGNIKIKGTVTPAGAAGNEAGVNVMDGTIATSGSGDVHIIGNVGPGKAGSAPANAGVVVGGDTTLPAPTASVISGGKLTIRSKGNIELAPGGSLTALGTGNALVIDAGGEFVDDAGPGAINTPNGQSQIRDHDNGGNDGDTGGDD